MNRVVCIIPARFDSTRFPGKPLALIRGVNGESKPLIQRTWEIAKRSLAVQETYIATDDDRIAEVARDFGAQVVMTGAHLRNGTERCAEAAIRLDLDGTDIVINLQGDGVLTPPQYIDTIASYMANSEPSVVTCVYGRGNSYPAVVGEVTAVVDEQFRAMYFSRAAFPTLPQHARYQHIGIYGYRVAMLREYLLWEPGYREEAETLEQLRFLEKGRDVQCLQILLTPPPAREINYPEDIRPVEEELARWNIE